MAYANKTDAYHPWAPGLAHRVTEPLLTYEAVLAETAYHLRNAAGTLALVRTGMVTVALDINAEVDRLAALGERYRDRRPDFADICLIRRSELYPPHSVITIDVADFRVYRRNQRAVIPLIHPPAVH